MVYDYILVCIRDSAGKTSYLPILWQAQERLGLKQNTDEWSRLSGCIRWEVAGWMVGLKQMLQDLHKAPPLPQSSMGFD